MTSRLDFYIKAECMGRNCRTAPHELGNILGYLLDRTGDTLLPGSSRRFDIRKEVFYENRDILWTLW